MITYKSKAVFALVLLAILLMACGPAKPSPICNTSEYHTQAVFAINGAAENYVRYTRGTTDYDEALYQGQGIARDIRDLNCSGDEATIVNNILKSSLFAIEAEETSGFSIANIYIEKAFNGINVLQTYYGWRI